MNEIIITNNEFQAALQQILKQDPMLVARLLSMTPAQAEEDRARIEADYFALVRSYTQAIDAGEALLELWQPKGVTDRDYTGFLRADLRGLHRCDVSRFLPLLDPERGMEDFMRLFCMNAQYRAGDVQTILRNAEVRLPASPEETYPNTFSDPAVCPRCGTALEDAARFCPSCGASVPVNPDPPVAAIYAAPDRFCK